MRALGLGDRLPVASEEKYLNAWQEMGFPPETVALAYDKTVLKCHELKWPYCNGIFKALARGGLTYPGGDRTGGQAPGEATDTVGGRRLEICVRRSGDMAYDGRLLRLAQERYEADRSAGKRIWRSSGNSSMPADPGCGKFRISCAARPAR